MKAKAIKKHPAKGAMEKTNGTAELLKDDSKNFQVIF
jgi:hypothetical protein